MQRGTTAPPTHGKGVQVADVGSAARCPSPGECKEAPARSRTARGAGAGSLQRGGEPVDGPVTLHYHPAHATGGRTDLGGALAGPGDGGEPDVERVGDRLVGPGRPVAGLVGLEQNAGPGQGVAGSRSIDENRAVLSGEMNGVLVV